MSHDYKGYEEDAPDGQTDIVCEHTEISHKMPLFVKQNESQAICFERRVVKPVVDATATYETRMEIGSISEAVFERVQLANWRY